MRDLVTPHEGPHTWDEFVELDEDDLRELIDGELIEVEVPNLRHEHIVMMLGFFLTQWARAGNGGFALGSGYKIRITNKRGVMPDAQFFRRGNDVAIKQEKGLVEGVPDLVVEIMSPSSRRYDRVKKLGWYAERGVPEYWIIDPEAQTIEQLVLREGRYAIEKSASGDETFEPATFPGLAVPLAELWEPRAAQ